MSQVEQEALVALLVPLAGGLGSLLAALAVLLYKRLLEKLPANQREEAARLVQVAVAAAEQAMPGAAGEDKKAAVLSDLEAIFKASHLSVPPQLVNAFIESAVLAMHDGAPPASAGAPVGFQPGPAPQTAPVPLVSPDAPTSRIH